FGVIIEKSGIDVYAHGDDYETKIADLNMTKIKDIKTDEDEEAILVYLSDSELKLTRESIVYFKDNELIEYRCEDCDAYCSEYDEYVEEGDKLVCQECR